MNKKIWISFVGLVVAVFFGFELTAIFDSNPDTITLTSTIIQVVPADVFFIVLGGLGVWVLFHFLKYYLR